MTVPFNLEENGKWGVISAEKQFFTGRCILDVCAEVSCLYHVSYDARSDQDAIIIKISPKDEERRLSDTDLRDFMNKLIDHQSWLDLNKEFGEIRQKIVSEAFSPLKKL